MPSNPSIEIQNSQPAKVAEERSVEPVTHLEVTDALQSSDRQVQSKIRWEWNLPLLGISLAVAIGTLTIAILVHAIQAKRVAEGLSNLAKKAMAQQDYVMEAKWLKQLVAFDFRYDRSLERLAIATNRSVNSQEEIEQARQSLVRAIATLNDEEDVDRIKSLRRLLIQRLLEMPATWAPEAEKQVLLLNPSKDDQEALRWLALSLFIQVENGEWRPRDKSRFDENKEYWNWMSCQSVGFVLENAEAKNPSASDLKIALLSCYVERPELFDSPVQTETKPTYLDKAQRLINELQKYDDGRAQWASFAFSEKLDQKLSEPLLQSIATDAVKRLQKPTDSILQTKRLDIRPATRYWDMNIAMSQAAKWENVGRSEEADALYQQLIMVDKTQIPEQLLANLYLQFGRSLWKRKNRDLALDILRRGCKETGQGSSLELWELIAVIQCEQNDLEQAVKAIADLEEAVQLARELYIALPVRDAIREFELKRLAAIRWHAKLLKSEQNLRSNPKWQDIQILEDLLRSQEDISAALRFRGHLILANAYAQNGFWDMEARTLEDALNLAPEDKFIRKRVGEAWLRSGVLTRAESQLKSADDGSFAASLQHLQVLIALQQTMPIETRRIEKVRQLQEQTRQRLQTEKAAGKNHEQGWLFELIESCHVIDSLGSNNLEFGTQSDKSLLQLVQAYPDNVELQALAARSFSALGDKESTLLALKNLDLLKTRSPLVWFETNLKIQLQDKHYQQAEEFIEQSAAEKILPNSTLYRTAASSFLELGNQEEACRILLLNEETDDISYLFFLANQLLQLSQQQGDPKLTDPLSTDVSRVVSRLQRLEGVQGTLSQYLEAAMLLNSAQSKANDNDLNQATKIIRRVIDVRPRWMDALKLAGDIRAAARDAEEAVDFYRRAIAEGDSRVATVFLLAQQLSELGRFSEAETEFQRIAYLSSSSRVISEFAIGLEQHKGNDAKALELARAATARHPEDSSAWLIQAQAAVRQHTSTGNPTSELVDEAESCFLKANELAKGANPSIWMAQLRFYSRYRSLEKTESVIATLRQSPLSEKSRGLLSAQAYIAMQAYVKAIDELVSASKKLPYDIDILNALSEVYRLNGQPNQSLDSLEKAYQLNPKRSDIARSLAMMLATRTSADKSVPWSRIRSIVENTEAQSADAKNLFYAFLLATRGGNEQREQALSLLAQLIPSSERSVAEDAIRLSIALHRQLWEEANKTSMKDVMLVQQREIQRLFDLLWRSSERLTLINDLYQHADFLLQVGERARIATLISDFEQISPSSPLLLNLRFQLALAEGQKEQIADKVREWIGEEQAKRNAPLMAEAGRLLSEQGLHAEAIAYLQSAYDLDSQWLRPLIVGLSRSGKLQDALKLCVERYNAEPNVETASILTDLAILSVGQFPLDPSIDQLIGASLGKFPTNPKLTELVGTLRLFQQKYREAIDLFLRAENLEPQSLITLNNLAIAASELPGREREGLARIEKAIQLYGQTPDLLDTLGTVQLACGLPLEAEKSLTASWKAQPDTRTLLHLLQALQVQGKQVEIRERLSAFKLSDLKGVVLTPREQQALSSLRQNYADSITIEESL